MLIPSRGIGIGVEFFIDIFPPTGKIKSRMCMDHEWYDILALVIV